MKRHTKLRRRSWSVSPLLLICLAFGRLVQSSVGQPANDLFANRLGLVGTSITVQGSNALAGTEPGERAGTNGGMLLYTVWYSWTAPTNGFVHLTGSASDPSFFLNIGAFRGDSPATLVPATTIASNAIPVSSGDILQIQVGSIYYPVWGGGGGSGPFTLNLWWEPPPPPSSSVADQSQTIWEGRASLRGNPAVKVTLGQTFTPAISGRLEKLFLVGTFNDLVAEHPTTISIVDTVDDRPGTNQLGRVVVQHLAGEMTISFLDQEIYLVAETPYAMVLSTDAPAGTTATYSFGTGSGNHYSRGILWQKANSGPWQTWSIFGDRSITWDMVFTTYMIPGIPAIRLTAPRGGMVLRVGEAAALQAEPSPSLISPFSIRFFASGELLGLVTNPPFTLDWTPTTTGDVDLTATLTKSSGNTATSAPVRVTLLPPGPTNDDFAKRALLVGDYALTTASNSDASLEPGEPRPVPNSRGQSVWWQWTVPRSARAFISVEEPATLNALVSVFVGSAVDALLLVTNGTGGCQFEANAGAIYQIALDSMSSSLSDASLVAALNDVEISSPGPNAVFKAPASFVVRGQRTGTARDIAEVRFYRGETEVGTDALEPYESPIEIDEPGYYRLHLDVRDARSLITESKPVSVIVRPGNDNFADADVLSGYSFNVRDSNKAATMEGRRTWPWDTRGGEPIWADNQGGHSIWYRWIAPASGVCTIGGRGEGFDLLLSAHVGDSVGTIMPVAFNAMGTPDPITFEVAAGKTYQLSVDGFFGEEGKLEWWLALRPRNDDFISRQQFVGPFYEVLASLQGATLETPEARLVGETNAVSLWWSWTAPASGPVTISTRSSAALTRVIVFTGPGLPDLQIAADTASWSLDNSLSFAAVQGTVYQIAVLGRPDRNGDFVLSLRSDGLLLSNPLDGSIFSAPASLTLGAALAGPAVALKQVEFWANDRLLGSVDQPPYVLPWSNVAAGTYTLRAKAASQEGATYSSLPVTILVYANEHLPVPHVFAAQRGYCSYVMNALGALYVFGAASNQFGLGPNVNLFWPQLAAQPPGGGRWLQITGGRFDVTHVQWALSDQGQLYRNGTDFVPFPVGVQRWIKVSGGYGTAISVGDDGGAYRNGRDPINFAAAGPWADVGEGYGYSATMDRSGRALLHRTGVFGQPVSDEVPLPPGVSHFVELAVGDHAFLLHGDNGQLYEMGVLTQSFSVVPTPRLVPLPAGVIRWSAFSVGAF